MANTFALLTLAKPTGLTGSLQAGGNLASNTTYYYRVFACRNEGMNITTFSPRSDTFSITTDAGNKTVALSWTAIPGYSPSADKRNSYHLLRNTADDFSDPVSCLLCTGSSSSGSLDITTNSYNDTNVTNYGLGQTVNYKKGLPTILVSGGTSGTPLLMYDIWHADIANGWGLVFPAADLTAIEYDVWKKNSGIYFVHANLKIGFNASNVNTTTYFKHNNGAIILYGSLGLGGNTTTYLGNKVNTYDSHLNNRVFIVTSGPYFNGGDDQYYGTCYWYGVSLIQLGINWGSNAYLGWNNQYQSRDMNASAGSEIFDCDFPVNNNGFKIYGYGTYRGCRYPGLALKTGNATVVTPKITNVEGIGLDQNQDNITFQSPTSTFSAQDIAWYTGYNQTIIDGIFLSKNQTDNVPWLFLGYNSNGMPLTGSLTFKFTSNLTVIDDQGNLLAGVAISIKNLAGTVVSSGTTDANGFFSSGARIHRVLTPLISKTGYEGYSPKSENSMVTDGVLARTYHTPHIVIFSKPGYKTLSMPYNMYKTRDDLVMMSPGSHNTVGSDIIRRVR